MPESGSGEEVEFTKTEGDDDRRKSFLDSTQTGGLVTRPAQEPE